MPSKFNTFSNFPMVRPSQGPDPDLGLDKSPNQTKNKFSFMAVSTRSRYGLFIATIQIFTEISKSTP